MISSVFSFMNSDDEDDPEEFTEEERENDPAKKILWAAENNYLDVVKEILTKNPGIVNSKDSDLYTPLHRASYNDHYEMIKLLVENGADIAAKTMDGWQPLHSASRWNCTKAAQLLLSVGADVNATTAGGLSPLHIAASQPDTGPMLELLLSNPFTDVTLISAAGETAAVLARRHSPHAAMFVIKDPAVNCLKLLD